MALIHKGHRTPGARHLSQPCEAIGTKRFSWCRYGRLLREFQALAIDQRVNDDPGDSQEVPSPTTEASNPQFGCPITPTCRATHWCWLIRSNNSALRLRASTICSSVMCASRFSLNLTADPEP